MGFVMSRPLLESSLSRMSTSFRKINGPLTGHDMNAAYPDLLAVDTFIPRAVQGGMPKVQWKTPLALRRW